MVLPSSGSISSSRSPRSSSIASGVVKVAESVTGAGRFRLFSPVGLCFARYAVGALRSRPLRSDPLQGLAELVLAHVACQIAASEGAADPPDLKTARVKGATKGWCRWRLMNLRFYFLNQGERYITVIWVAPTLDAVSIRISQKIKRFLVSVHVICAMGWVGSVLAVLFLLSIRDRSALAQSYEISELCKKIDDQLIIPFAMLSLVSGLVLCSALNWGFVRHWWIVVKGLMTVSFIVFGTIALGPWLNKSAEIASATSGVTSLVSLVTQHDRLYLQLSHLLSAGVPIQLLLLLIIVVISYVKPWGLTPWRHR